MSIRLDPSSWALPVAVDWRREFVAVQVLCWCWVWRRQAPAVRIIPVRVVTVAALLAAISSDRSAADEDLAKRLMERSAGRN